MIRIIHGEDTKASRDYFITEKSDKENPFVFDGLTVTLTDLVQIIEGGGLFESEKYVFIENFLSKRKPSKEVDQIVSFLNSNEKKASIFFWEGKALTKKQASFFPKALIKQFKLPQTLFAFLDGISKDQTRNIQLFHASLKNSEPELLFFMLQRQFRLLLAILLGSDIDEVKRLAPWQKSKLEKQAHIFSKEELTQVYKKLYEIDLAQKTGNLTGILANTIDFLLLEI